VGRHTFFVLIALTIVWIVLMEGISWQAVAMGMISSLVCMHFGSKFLPYAEIDSVDFFKLIGFPFFLFGQIYVAGIDVMRIIIKGCKVDVITIKTELKAESLRVMLADCITLVPGSILLELDGEDATILWITTAVNGLDAEAAEENLKGKLERRLLKAQKIKTPKDAGADAHLYKGE